LVFADSKLRKDEDAVDSCPAAAKNARKQYVKIIDERYVLLQDVLFPSSSSAAKFVLLSNESGNAVWKTAEGMKRQRGH
jgi:hypothetical protein